MASWSAGKAGAGLGRRGPCVPLRPPGGLVLCSQSLGPDSSSLRTAAAPGGKRVPSEPVCESGQAVPPGRGLSPHLCYPSAGVAGFLFEDPFTPLNPTPTPGIRAPAPG